MSVITVFEQQCILYWCWIFFAILFIERSKSEIVEEIIEINVVFPCCSSLDCLEFHTSKIMKSCNGEVVSLSKRVD